MKCSKGRMSDCLRYNFRRWTWDELDYSGWNTCFGEDLVDYVVGVGGSWRGFPHYYVADDRRC